MILALLVIVLGGICVATQAPINGRLAAAVGDPILAAGVSFGVGFAILALISAAKGALPGLAGGLEAPWWVWTGGAFGAFFVWSTVWSVGSVGAVTLVSALILGQMAAALAIDATGAFGLAVREIGWPRLAGAGLVAAGVVMSRL